MKKLKLQWLAPIMLVAVMLFVTGMSHAEDPSVGVTGFTWLKMSDKNQRAYVEGALDGFVYAFGITGDNQLGWSLKYININMKWDLFMNLIKKHFKENPGQVHNVMVIAIKDALENGIPDKPDEEYKDEDNMGFVDDRDLVMDDK